MFSIIGPPVPLLSHGYFEMSASCPESLVASRPSVGQDKMPSAYGGTILSCRAALNYYRAKPTSNRTFHTGYRILYPESAAQSRRPHHQGRAMARSQASFVASVGLGSPNAAGVLAFASCIPLELAAGGIR